MLTINESIMIEKLYLATSSIFQLYPFGYANGDTGLSSDEGSSSSITLTKSVRFYNEIIRTAYVSYKLKHVHINTLVN